jgi:hypothetical protein
LCRHHHHHSAQILALVTPLLAKLLLPRDDVPVDIDRDAVLRHVCVGVENSDRGVQIRGGGEGKKLLRSRKNSNDLQ